MDDKDPRAVIALRWENEKMQMEKSKVAGGREGAGGEVLL